MSALLPVRAKSSSPRTVRAAIKKFAKDAEKSSSDAMVDKLALTPEDERRELFREGYKLYELAKSKPVVSEHFKYLESGLILLARSLRYGKYIRVFLKTQEERKAMVADSRKSLQEISTSRLNGQLIGSTSIQSHKAPGNISSWATKRKRHP